MSTTSRSASETLRVPGAAGRRATIAVDGRQVEALEGESLLAALWADGVRALHVTAIAGEPRGPLCGIGVCFDCLVVVDGRRSTRACMTAVEEGMTVELQRDAGWEGHGDERA